MAAKRSRHTGYIDGSPVTILICENCKAGFTVELDKKGRVINHQYCPICRKVAMRKYAYAHDERLRLGSKLELQLICPQCGREFFKKKTYKCPDCRVALRVKETLKLNGELQDGF